MNNIVLDGNDEDCPHCKAKESLRPARDFEILNIGLTTEDYE